MNRVYKSTKREKPVSPLVSYWRRLDKPLILAALLCSLLSIILLYSIWQNHIISSVGASYYRTQLLSCGLGMVCLLVLSAIDYHKIVRLWFLYAPIALVLTLLTFTALGHRRAGADDQAWLNLGFIQFQPSEVLKLAFILTFSLHLAKDEGNMNKPLHMLLLCVHGAIPTGLIALQGDYGTAIVFAVIFLGMLFAAKISWKYVLAFLIAIPAALVVAWNFLLGDTHKKRILVLLHPAQTRKISSTSRTVVWRRSPTARSSVSVSTPARKTMCPCRKYTTTLCSHRWDRRWGSWALSLSFWC